MAKVMIKQALKSNHNNASTQYLLAIDNGTQSIRALLFDFQGNLVAKSKIDIEAYFSKEPGWAEQAPDYYWEMLGKACKKLWPILDDLSIDKTQITGVSITCQRATMVNVDINGKPLRPAMVWLDQREQDILPKMSLLWRTLFSLAGENKTIEHFRKQAKSNWIAANEKSLWQNTHKYLFLSGFHSFKLTGEFVDSVSSQVGYVPFDYKNQTWCKPNDWRWQAMPITKNMLPKLIPCGEKLGVITKQAAIETGIPEGLVLISSGSDKACEVLGSGCIKPNQGSLSYGTTATFNTTHTSYIEIFKRMPAYPAAVPKLFNSEIIVQRGYWMVSWFKREFGLREEQIAKEKGIATEILIDDLLKQVPAGSMGLMLQPYWSPGIKTPGPEAKGAMIGFGDVHTRAHIYKAMIEGLTYALREGKENSERKANVNITQLMVSGGGSQSDEVMQITADIFGMTVYRPHTFETSGLGAAINVAVGVGAYKNYDEAIKQMCHAGDSFDPISKNVAIYDELYKHVYQKMYKRLNPLYKAIKLITGYPK
jgi:sugar (pentulose or hexulose) kinase